MVMLFTAAQAREADITAIEDLGLDSLVLMENAGRSITSWLEVLQVEYKSVAIICGKGNNGGDGFVAARHLRDHGWSVTVIFVGEPEEFSDDAKFYFDIISENPRGISIFQYKDPEQLKELVANSMVVVDALLGTGSKGELRYPYDEVIITLNDEPGVKVAVDIPSGLDPDKGTGGIVFKAHQTVAMGSFKRGYFYGKGIECTGAIEYGYIGYKEEDVDPDSNWWLYQKADVKGINLFKTRTVNKYSAGGPVIVAGSNRYPGAASLVYQGAFHSGSGSPVIFTSDKAAAVLLNQTPEAVVVEYPVNFNSESLKQMFDILEKKDVLLIGPGLGRSPETTMALEKVLQIENKLVMLDADALVPLYNGNYKNYDLHGKILLPHTGEFAAILGQTLDEIEEDIFTAAEKFAMDTGAILVLKHAAVFICTPSGQNYVCDSGSEELAKFGTGDGLAGVIASTLAQFLAYPMFDPSELQEGLREANAVACETYAERIADAVHTFNFSAHLLARDFPGTPVSASTIVKNIPYTIKNWMKIGGAGT